MKNKSLTPHIRFKGYDDEWQQSSFGEVCTVHDGVHQTPRYTDSGVMFVSVENIKSLQSNKFISIEAFKSDYKTVPERNDILMTRIGDIGTANIVLSDEPMAYYVSLALLKSPSIDSFFFKSSIGCPDTKRELWKRTLHIAFPKKINKNEISHVGIKLPSASEQKDIGDFFRQIDEVLHDTEREITRLEKMKQASLQKMFPRPGETTPEIRFDGFTEPWKKETFSDVFTPLKNNTLSRDCLNYTTGMAKNIHYGDVLIKFGSVININDDIVPYVNETVSFSQSPLHLLKDGDIIFADTAEDEAVGKCVEIIGATEFNSVSGLHTIAVRPNFSFAPSFLGYYLNSSTYHSQLLPLMQGVKVLSIGRNALATTEICYPTSHEEQRVIGEYFRNLDAIISAKRKKLDKLQNLKQSCLDKMFVNTAAQ